MKVTGCYGCATLLLCPRHDAEARAFNALIGEDDPCVVSGCTLEYGHEGEHVSERKYGDGVNYHAGQE